MLKKHNAVLLFTCMEKVDKNEPPDGMCSPQSLIRETARAASLNGENPQFQAGDSARPNN